MRSSGRVLPSAVARARASCDGSNLVLHQWARDTEPTIKSVGRRRSEKAEAIRRFLEKTFDVVHRNKCGRGGGYHDDGVIVA